MMTCLGLIIIIGAKQLSCPTLYPPVMDATLRRLIIEKSTFGTSIIYFYCVLNLECPRGSREKVRMKVQDIGGPTF